MSFFEVLYEAPVHTLFMASGIVFLVIAIIGRWPGPGQFEVGKIARVTAFLIGPIFIIIGLSIFFVPPPSPSPIPPDGPNTIDPVPDTVTDTSNPTYQASPGVTITEGGEWNDNPDFATFVGKRATISGEIRGVDNYQSQDIDYFQFQTEAGDPISVQVDRQSGVGTLYVIVLGPDYRSLPSGDFRTDVRTVNGGQTQVQFDAQPSGYYYVGVGGYYNDPYSSVGIVSDGGYGKYTIQIGETN